MTAPVAPMEARCAMCGDTGSKSQDIDGHQDCTACDAVERRAHVMGYLRELSPYMTVGSKAWAAYLFAQRQAAPVAQPAQQVEAPECGACHGTGWVPRDADIGTEQECFSCDGSGEGEVTTPQLEAQQAGDVARTHSRVIPNWAPCNPACDSELNHGVECRDILCACEAAKESITRQRAIAQGRKA